jgi:ArsR family transcriptional regulator
MEDLAEIARLLDILGNRNRRRIIGLLRQKPCFVTEISETLMISPKAVIEHLQLMEREEILSCQMDDRRRKYYYLANDILVDVSLRSLQSAITRQEDIAAGNAAGERTRQAVVMLAKMVQAHDQLVAHLEQLNHDIETKLADLARNHNDLFRSERELSVAIALSHEPLTPAELAEATGCPEEELGPVLATFEKKGIVSRTKNRITLRGVHADESQQPLR